MLLVESDTVGIYPWLQTLPDETTSISKAKFAQYSIFIITNGALQKLLQDLKHPKTFPINAGVRKTFIRQWKKCPTFQESFLYL